MVRSQLLYCSIIWRPNLMKHITMLERIQRRAILNDYTSNYKSRLIALDLLPLSMVIELADITFFLKSLHSPSHSSHSSHSPHSSFDIMDYVTFSTSNTRSSTKLKLKHNLSSNNLTRHFYFNHLPRVWNLLPSFDSKIPLSTVTNYIKQFYW